MKRWIWGSMIIAAILVVLFLAGQAWDPDRSADKPVAVSQVEQQVETDTSLPVYTADVQVDPQAHRVSGAVIVRFVPPDPQEVYFHLYPNVFRDDAALQTANWEYILGEERQPGGITVSQVTVNDEAVAPRVNGTILHVPLPSTDRGKQVTEISLAFELQLPRNNGRLSYNDHALWLGNWLPTLAVREGEEWRLDPYLPMGDPFFSELADYHLRIRVPAAYQIASTGAESIAVITETKPEGEKLYEVDGTSVRDFAFVVMDETYHALVDKAGDTLVRTWWQEGDDPKAIRRLHDVAVHSLLYFNETFGNYPYPEYDVVKTGGFFGGMEYPGIVFIQGSFFDDESVFGSAVVAHETAHQWFYGLVGSDAIREAWVDESLTDYATMDFLQQYDNTMAESYIRMRTSRGRQAEVLYPDLAVWQPLHQFPDWQSYSDLVYSRGATMLWELRAKWGAKQLNTVLRQYAAENRDQTGTGQELLQAFSQAAGADATPYFDYWLRLQTEKKREAEAWAAEGAKKRRQENDG
ncbi:M1 family metallopeptidase [Brevibacillus humidisoli]|uniref:M1 family metallopeptidase n=1 Tax=Brevibacillus humidisoli TaxID=2895522 RepID=UPI001E3A329C|nr:M1 family metallopeptidase [Brevibacillus humidisoli]UFJ40977.1 M1 family metallopeptidase [Brevibacillus humidisoli]